jgi:hypothetical protein
MHARWRVGSASGQSAVRLSRAVLAALVLLLAAGCGSAAKAAEPGSSSPAGASSPPAGTPCGTTRTAANVPVHVEVEHGQVSCTLAMTVERDYAKAILDGRAPGNGGGGPVKVKGWTCQGFATPEVLQTGQASKCVHGSTEILAILPAPA